MTMRLQKEKWNFKNLNEVHQSANTVLRFAMFNERSKRWPKVAESYKRLIWLVDKSHFPKDYEPPNSYAILMYELHYHLGVALQRLDQHRKAIVQFTKAIQSVSIPKGGCLAGCVANSCLMTPILARRAFAYAKVGDLRSALRDADNAVVLDNQNPDVYCIRALVRGSRDEEPLAVEDVDAGLKLNASHVCALVIRGALSRTLVDEENKINKFHRKAEKLNPESQSYYTVSDFDHPYILDFYDRFLFTLSVPHTITDINLTPDKPSQKQLAQLERERTKRSLLEQREQRASSAAAYPSSRSHQSQNQVTPSVTPYSRKSSAISQGKPSLSPTVAPPDNTLSTLLTPGQPGTDRPTDRGSFLSEISSPKPSVRLDVETKTSSGRTTKTTCTKTFTFETPSNYSIPVFQPVNIRGAPRMYYRPWRGDKLPVADIDLPEPAPAFY